MPETVLIVDDDPAVRRVLRKMLQPAGYPLLEAADGDEALRLVKDRLPSLILLDMHMPRMDGIAALDHILEIDPKARVIMVTGDGDDARTRLALERGACDVILKPFGAEGLRNSVLVNLAAR